MTHWLVLRVFIQHYSGSITVRSFLKLFCILFIINQSDEECQVPYPHPTSIKIKPIYKYVKYGDVFILNAIIIHLILVSIQNMADYDKDGNVSTCVLVIIICIKICNECISLVDIHDLFYIHISLKHMVYISISSYPGTPPNTILSHNQRQIA